MEGEKFLWVGRVGLGCLLAALLYTPGCNGVKKTTRTPMPAKISQAKTATPAELRALVDRLASAVNSIQCTSLVLDAQGGNLETQTIEKYRSAPGYVFVARPHQIRLKILVPVAKNTLFDMASDGVNFNIWYPRENKFFTGPANIRWVRYESVEKNPLSRFRPQHLVDALLFEKISDDKADKKSFIYEEADEQAKYYVIGVVNTSAAGSLTLTQRVWIERSELKVVRRQYYESDSSLLEDITYSQYMPVEGLNYPSTIGLSRPGDQYSITLRLQTFKINQMMAPDTFTIHRPPGVELVEVKSDEPKGESKP